MKFVDVKNDIAFRKVFGNENRKESLISFLNGISEELIAKSLNISIEKVQKILENHKK